MKHPVLTIILSVGILLFPLLALAWNHLRRRLPGWVLELIPLALLLWAVGAVYWPLLQGHPPTVADHGFQILKEVEATHRLNHFSLFGWSDREYAGFPENVNYPLVGAMMSAALHALPGVDVEMAYAWSLWIQIAAIALATYFAGRLHFGRLAGLIAGLFTLLDGGSYWVGGYFSTIRIGMWIQSLATAFLLAGLAVWPLAVTSGRRRTAVWAGVLLGTAALCHPQTVIHGGIAGVIMVMALLTTTDVSVARIAKTSGYIAVVAFGVCAWWLIPYLARGSFQSFPTFGSPSGQEMWNDLVKGDILGIPAMFFGAALVGMLLLMGRTRDPFSRFMALMIPFVIIFFTQDGLTLLHLRHTDASLADRLQLTRSYYLMRPLGMLAAAYGLVRGLSRAERWARNRSWRFLPSRILVAFLAGLLLQLDAVKMPNVPEEPNPQGLNAPERASMEMALDEAARWVGPDDRLALRSSDWMDHTLVYQAALRGFKLEVLGGDAAIMFRNRFASEDVGLLGRIGCTAIITRGDVPDSMKNLFVLGEFPPFAVRAIPREPRAWIERGSGKVDIVAWTDEEIRLRLSSVSVGAKVGLGFDYYDTWKASNGRKLTPLVWLSGPLGGQDCENRLSDIEARNGDLTLTYHAPKVQWLAQGTSALTLLGLWFLPWLFSRRRQLRPAEVPLPAVGQSSAA